MAKGDFVGEFELYVMLALAHQGDDAYGVTNPARDRSAHRPDGGHRRGLCDAGAARGEGARAVPRVRSAAGARRTRQKILQPHRNRGSSAPAFDRDARAHDGRTVARFMGRPVMSNPGAPSPPGLAQALVRLLLAPENRAFLAADLAEEFDELAATVGAAAARRWYWKQACLSAPPLIRQRVTTLITSRMMSAAPDRREGRTCMGLLTDLRYAWRMSRRAPVVTISVTLAIALGIAASTAIFSVMEGVFLRPLPFPAPGRLVRFSTTVANVGRVPEVNYLDAQDWKATSTHLESIGLYDVAPGTVRVREDAPPFSATLMLATAEVIPVLGVRPLSGRVLQPEEYGFGAPPAVMLGFRFWKSHFAGDPSAVGRTLQVGAVRHTIVGVLPPEADRFPAGGADVWTALTFPPSSFLNQRGSIALSAIGRLRAGATMAAASSEFSTIAARLALTYPDTNRDRSIRLDGLQDAMVGPIKPVMVLLALSVAMLLAVACANIANLLLAQAHARTLEFGIRGAVGASPRRLARQLWTESLALFAVAGAIGVALAQPLALWLVSRYPDTLPLAADVTLDGRVLAIAAACTLGAALLTGFPRARRLRDTEVGADLRGDARSGLTVGHRRMTNVLVAAQVSISIVLLFGGILLLRTFLNLTSTKPGFDPEGVITIRTSIPPIPHGEPAQVVALQDRLREVAASLPGVTAAAHAMFIPFTLGSWGDGYRRAGTADAAPRGPMAHFFMVSPEVLRGDAHSGSSRTSFVRLGSRRRDARNHGERDICEDRVSRPGRHRPPHRVERRHLGDRRGRGRHPPRGAQRSLRRRRLRPAPPGRARQYLAPAQDRPSGCCGSCRIAGTHEVNRCRRRLDRHGDDGGAAGEERRS